MIVEHGIGNNEIKNTDNLSVEINHDTKLKVNRDKNVRLREKNRQNPKLTQSNPAQKSKPKTEKQSVKIKRYSAKRAKTKHTAPAKHIVASPPKPKLKPEQSSEEIISILRSKKAPHVVPVPLKRSKAKVNRRPVKTVNHKPQQSFVVDHDVIEPLIVDEHISNDDVSVEEQKPLPAPKSLRKKKKNRFDNPHASDKVVKSGDDGPSIVKHAPLKRSVYRKPIRPETVKEQETEEKVFAHPTFEEGGDNAGTPVEETPPVKEQVEKVEETESKSEPKKVTGKEHVIKPAPMVKEEPVVEKEPTPVFDNVNKLNNYFKGDINKIVDGILNVGIDFEKIEISATIPKFDIVYGEEGFAKATDDTNVTLQTKTPKAVIYLVSNMLKNITSMGIQQEKIIHMISDMFEMCGSVEEWIKLIDELYKEIVKQAS